MSLKRTRTFRKAWLKTRTTLISLYLKKLINKLPKRKELSRWWRPVPESHYNQEITKKAGYDGEKLSIWRKKLLAVEKAVKDGNVELAHE